MLRASEALATQLEDKMSELSRRCIEAMYRDPFWQARFGDRGRAHAEQDSAYHVKYVVAALRADDARVFKNYAIWLRGVLASRGMCSWHLRQAFRELGNATADEQISERERAIDVLNAGAAALEYVEGPAAPLQARADELLRATRERLETPAYRLDELWSFLLDGLARGDSQSLGKHVAFLESTLAADVGSQGQLRLTLSTLRDTCDHECDADSAARVRRLIVTSHA